MLLTDSVENHVKGDMMKLKIVALAGILAVVLFSVLFQGQYSLIVFAQDSQGNDITFFEIDQYNGSAWVNVANFTSTGQTARIHDGWQTGFLVGVKLNKTLASDSATAISYTKCNMTISYDSSYVWDNVNLNQTGSVQNDDSFWYINFQGNWTSNLPAQGVTYNCTVTYQAYY